jgi:hypothetical protein
LENVNTFLLPHCCSGFRFNKNFAALADRRQRLAGIADRPAPRKKRAT